MCIEFYTEDSIVIEAYQREELSIVNNAVAVQMGGGYVDFSIFRETVSSK